MNMKKGVYALCSIFILVVVVNVPRVLSQDSESNIKIFYEPVDKYQSENLLVLQFKVKVQNKGSSPIYDVTLKLQSDLVTNYPDTHLFDVINSEEMVTSQEIHEIAFESTHEPPLLFWSVQYSDIDGNLIEETIQ